MFFRNKIIILLFFCFTYLSAQPMKLSEKFDPMAKFGLSTKKLPSSKTRKVDSLDCELVGGWFRGPSLAVCVVDTLAYIGAGQSMKILNVNDSANPVLLGEILLPSFLITDIFVKGTLAYVIDYEEGLRVINVSDPYSPTEIGFCETPGYAQALWIQDNFAYIADTDPSGPSDDGLRIIDVSDPSNPAIVGSYNESLHYAFEDVWVQDTIAYVAGTGLHIINVSEPSLPDSISVCIDTLYYSRLYVRDTLVYVASWDSDNGRLCMSIINVVDPSSPIEVGSYYLHISFPYNSGHIGNIYVEDSLAYIGVYSMADDPEIDSCGLYIVNVSDPASMNAVGNYLTGGGRAQDVWVRDNLAYVSCCASFPGDPEGLLIIDVSDPSAPTKIGEYDTGNWIEDVWVKDSLAYVANRGRGLNIINISNPSSPFEAGFCDSSVYPRRVFVKDTFAYVRGDSGLSIIDVANPSSPIETNFHNMQSSYWSHAVWVQDTFAYVAEGDSGLSIINVADPSSPTEIVFYNTPGGVRDIWVRDTLAYLAAGGLYIIDVSTPSLPTEVGSLPGGFEAIFVKDTLAYVIDGNLHIINISDPSLPIEIGSCNLSGEGWHEGIWVKDKLAYVARDTSGLRIIEVSDPSNPFEVGFYNIYWGGYPNASDVYAQDSLIYVAYGRAGLYILKYTGPYGGIEEPTTD
jgi:hypothetical protein